ncbi:hypothetical protein CPB86DRAFT_816513 [Serendipita vermifera]|nr:hypothetical protein CPB86DRAFT_816513 [Serendipita vermifera]
MAQTPLNAVCAVSLVYNVWSVLHFNTARSTQSTARTVILVLLPYLVFFLCAGAVLTVGLLRPELVSRATFYCVVRSDVLNIFVGIFGGLCCVVAIILEAWIAFLLRANRRKRELHRNANNINTTNNNQTSPSSTSTTSGMDVQLAIRVILFGFYIFFGLALSITSVLNWTSVVPDLCFSTFSIAVFAIFGSQQDIVRVWKRGFCCCFIKSEQESRRTTSHFRAGSIDPALGKHPLSPGAAGELGYQPGNDGRSGHNPYWYRGGEKKEKLMGDLATLNTRHTNTIGRSPYNSHTDFQFQFESDVGLGLVGNAQGGALRAPGSLGQHPNPSQVNVSDHKAGKKSKDAWWGALGHNKNGRPGTGGSAKQQRPGTAGTVNSANFGETSMSWYPDLGYDFVPEGTSHTEDLEVEMDVNRSANASEQNHASGETKKRPRKDSNMSGVKGHANPHTRHSSATVPSEYIGQSPRTPEFIYYEQEEAARSLPQLVSEMSPISPMPLLPKPTTRADEPKASSQPAHAHAPAITSRLHIEHRPSMESDTSASVSNANGSTPNLVGGPDARPRPPRSEPHHFAQLNASYRDSTGYQDSIGYTDSNGWRDSTGYRQSGEGEAGLPDYYLRQYSHHQHIHSTDYRSSLDSSIGGGARAAIVRGGDPRAGNCTYSNVVTNQYNIVTATTSNGMTGTKLYDSDYPEYVATTQSDYPYTFNYQHNNMSTHALDQIHGPSSQVAHHTQVYAPAPKSAFDRDGTGFEFISGRKRTGGADSPDSFITNPSLYHGRAY